MKTEHSIRFLCRCLDVSPSGYYQWRRQQEKPCKRAEENQALKVEVVRIHKESRRTYGSPRIRASLLQQGKRYGRNRIARLMREEKIYGRQNRRYRPRTTDSNHEHPIAPNLLAELQLDRANQAWVADITYVQTSEGWLYLAGVLDLYSRRIVGWGMSRRIDTALVLDAWKMALTHRQPGGELLFHSDRGVQYASSEFRRNLAEAGVTASMSRRGNCYDNAAMESFWSTLKFEMIYRRTFITRRQAEGEIFDYIETFYNRKRLHSSLGYLSPEQFEREHKLKNKSLAEHPGEATGGQGGAQQGTGARGEQYLEGTARSRTIAAKDLFSPNKKIPSNPDHQNL
jgi:transposase InsO family protein